MRQSGGWEDGGVCNWPVGRGSRTARVSTRPKEPASSQRQTDPSSMDNLAGT